ncbi:ribbon-helix-helix domain-containing protein [Catellatospora sp. KI3]|uniref:ribbon-helix-helix domain-containing protein n=1 Tax=unclassified Catellatospora TaxID=2645785 RepID=UPI001B281C60|nr:MULTISPECIES: ribbon-helix-helix domain-containing protein [unclassified Catellatospora]MDI1464927.1 ribbon-helix-helix domain-containing protein [Catellatospora sp. KI3]GHJ49662.1 hypothetical protein Cs7R123_70040 [Catellatospora sp. TT07R-123]
MKLSVSLPDEDVDFVDDYAERTGMSTRSSVLHRAIDLLRERDLEAAYADAFDEWEEGTDAPGPGWDVVAGDGLADAAR